MVIPNYIASSYIITREMGNIGIVKKSIGDKTWDVSEPYYEIGHWDSIIEINSASCDVVKSSSKP